MNNAFAEWLAASPLGTAAKVFVGTLISLGVAQLTTTGALDLTNWKAIVFPALASALVVIVNYLNPADPRYGKGSPKAGDRFDVFGTQD